jgi:anionic cell wall polymer biosynthesis LytR-Cps2A-Psr (LCP) family protein
MVPKILARWAFGGIETGPMLPPDIGTDISGPINFLLLGTDERNAGPDADSLLRSDSIVLVHIPASHDQVYMISFPRDLRVTIPASSESDYPGGIEKINAAFAFGARDAQGRRDTSVEGRGRGAVLAMRTISDIVKDTGGLKFSGWATINFEGFDKVVEALGSVHMCFDQDVYSIHYWANGKPADAQMYNYSQSHPDVDQNPKWGFHYPKGECWDMEPWQALDYSRQRVWLPETDYDRQRHQQQLIKAIVKKVASTEVLTNLGTISNLRSAAGDLLAMSLGSEPVENWVWTLRDLRADNITMIKTYGGKFNGEVYNDIWYEKLDQSLVELLKAVQTDTVFNFLAAHPDWIAEDTAPAS